MSYEKNTWTNGDVITSAKLNHIEDGIAESSILIVGEENNILDRTWQEIHDGLPAFIITGDEYETSVMAVSCAYVDDGDYVVQIGNKNYITKTPDGHPALDLN